VDFRRPPRGLGTTGRQRGQLERAVSGLRRARVRAPGADRRDRPGRGWGTVAWLHLDANARYQVWRDTRPYFDPTAPTTDTVKLDDVYPPVGGGLLTYSDATVDPNVTYYYAVVGVNALGQRSAAEKYLGVFRFGLTARE